jgi:hypothetical protein
METFKGNLILHRFLVRLGLGEIEGRDRDTKRQS